MNHDLAPVARRPRAFVFAAWLTMIFQFLFPLSLSLMPLMASAASVESILATPSPDFLNQELANAAKTAGTLLSNDEVSKQAESMLRSATVGAAVGKANSEAQQWLNQFGTARFQLNLNDRFNLEGSQFDMLLPWSDSERWLTFSQFGARRLDGRTTGNLGFGQRYFTPEWMLGYNLFADREFTNQHNRLGLGSEYRRDYLKLAANGYFALSDWKNSSDVVGYDEKSANGFDIRAEAWLPSLPQLGGKLMYEKYYGDEVGLFGKDKRQKDPSAYTIGLSYTPFPLLVLGVDRKAGQDSLKSTQIKLEVNYALGVPWAKQVNPAAVAAKRSLAGGRYDLVERNNQIVLKYRKQAQVFLTLPAKAEGLAGQVLNLAGTATASNGGIARIEWQAPSLSASGGHLPSGKDGDWQLTLPQYTAGGAVANTHLVTAVAYDSANNASLPAQLQVVVTGAGVSLDASSLQASLTRIPANPQGDGSVLTLTLHNEDKQPVTGLAALLNIQDDAAPVQAQAAAPVRWQHRLADGGFQESSQQPGVYIATLKAGNIARDVTVIPTLEGVALSGPNLQQVVTIYADPDSAQLGGGDGGGSDNGLTLSTNKALANGEEQIEVTAAVVDAGGNALEGIEVTFASSSGDLADTPAVMASRKGKSATSTLKVRTNKEGVAKVWLSNAVAEEVTVTATVGKSSADAAATFIADSNTAQLANDANALKADKLEAIADEEDKITVTATVTDAKGNKVDGVVVSFGASNGGVLSSRTVTTAGGGLAQVTLANKKAGPSRVSASVNGSSKDLDLKFKADVATAKLIALTRSSGSKDVVVAASETITAQVVDANDNPVPNVAVKFVASHSDTVSVITPDVANGGNTDDDGIVTATVTTTKMGSIQATASIKALNSAAEDVAISVPFVADVASAVIAATDFTVESGALADNGDVNLVTVLVKDKYGNPLKGVMPAYTASDVGISSISPSDKDGQSTAYAKSSKVGALSLSVKAPGQASAVSKSLSFVGVSALVAGGNTFAVNAGFPTTAFAGANFQLQVTGATLPDSNYSWSIQGTGVAVSDGKVTFNAQPGSDGQVLVKLTRKSRGIGSAYTGTVYTMNLSKWFVYTDGAKKNWADATKACSDLSGVLPQSSDITLGQTVRGVGALFSEWGNLATGYGWNNSATGGYQGYYWTATAPTIADYGHEHWHIDNGNSHSDNATVDDKLINYTCVLK
ncbi:inverse autotransporter beta domain-containing protein [Neisseriaceae bacterium TC5R-5]|nr:inverse autotransporter beta domain-containing protein [Neisseriaceae bacterium TC5R-5]